jgi:hypothetical protein
MIKEFKVNKPDENFKEFHRATLNAADLVLYFEDTSIKKEIQGMANLLDNDHNVIHIAENDYELWPKACFTPQEIKSLVDFSAPLVIFIGKAMATGLLAKIGGDIYKTIKNSLLTIIKKKHQLKTEFIHKRNIRLSIEYNQRLVVFDLYSYFDEEDFVGAIDNMPIFLQDDFDKVGSRSGPYTFGNPPVIYPIFDTKRKKWMEI